jgi:hypothetical protein
MTGHGGRPEGKHQVAAVPALQCVVMENLPFLAGLLPFHALDQREVALLIAERARDLIRRQRVAVIAAPFP